MSDALKGVIAMLGANLIWGFAPLFYKVLDHIPAAEIYAHRALWSFVFFALILAAQSRFHQVFSALATGRGLAITFAAGALISVNWYAFIWSIQAGRATEASLGYFIFPLVAVALGVIVFRERFSRSQALAIALVTIALVVLTYGLGAAPWLALLLSATFGLYSLIKKQITLGPVVSVTAEVLVVLPVAGLILYQGFADGSAHFAQSPSVSLMLVLSGPLTALPLILFSYAARRVRLSTIGLLQYMNPTLQFLCAVLVFGEPFGQWHAIAFPIIWVALAIYTLSALAQDRASRRAMVSAAGVSTVVTKSNTD